MHQMPARADLEGESDVIERGPSRTYTASKPKRVVFGITALRRFLIYRLQVPLWPEGVGVLEQCLVS